MSESTTRTKHLDLNRLTDDPAWPTKWQDLQAAVTILQRHAAQGEPLRLLEDGGEADGDRLWVPFPAWLVELANHFHGYHGEQGDVILQRLLNGLLLFDSLP